MPADLTSVDQNLQAIQAVEKSWALPALPDEVKLDLAGNGLMTAPAITTLMTGLATDLADAEKQQPLPTRADLGYEQPVNPSYGYAPKTNIGRTIASVTGLPTPQVYNVRAPQQLKQRLVDGGYLDLKPEEIESDQWLPEYSYAARQLNFDTMSSQFQGNKPGSMSVDSILGAVDQWLSPRGLYRAAVELDLWWDAGNIKREFQEWDDRLAAWRDDPFNPRKLVDLVTGPLDDLLFPALNIVLMFAGVGEVVAATRGLSLGVKGSQAMAGLYRGSRGLRFLELGMTDRALAQGAADVARFARPSFLSTKVEGALPKTAELMNAWRRNGAVILGKKANQQVMRMGFVSNVEQLVDADRGGQSLNRFTPLGDAVDTAFANPAVDWGVDLLLMPPNIFNPGTFSKPAKAFVEGVQGGFLKAAENQHLTMAFDRPVVQYLRESVSEEAAKSFERIRDKDGLQAALKQTFFDNDDETMGAAMAFVTTMAGVDHYARRAADVMAGDPLHELGSGTRTLFHMARNQAGARLKHLDEDNIEALLIHFAKYGTVEQGQRISRNANKFQAQYRDLREGYLEAAGATRARGGAIPEGHTRFIGHFDTDIGQYRWKPLRAGDEIEGDPFFLDVYDTELRSSLGDDADLILSGDRPLPDQFVNRYLRRDDDGRLRHWALSEAESMRLYDPEKLDALKGLARRHNEMRGKYLTEILNDLNPQALEQYVYEVLPTFGRWSDFVEASSEIHHAIDMGSLANAQFVSPMSEANRRLAAIPWTPNADKWVNEMFQMMLELPDDEKLAGSLMESVFSPFARDVDPQLGSFTAAGADTVTKQEALAFGATARRATKMAQAIARIKKMPQGNEWLAKTQQYLEMGEGVKKAGLAEVLAEAFGSTAITERTLDELGAIARIADEAGVTLDEVEEVILRKLSEIDGSARWSERYMVPTGMNRTGDLIKDVQAKVRELERQAYYMASEVTGVPDDLAEFLASRGYKLVYGVEFAQPFDLDGILPAFADASRRQIRQKRMGDFFGRQDPEAITALKVRKTRDALHARLSKVKGGIPLNLGAKVSSDNADLNRVVDDLFSILRSVQDEAQSSLEALQGRGPIARVAGRASLNQIPFSLDRLASDLPAEVFLKRVVDLGYSREQAAAIYQALQSTQALGWRTHGLYAIESKLRSSPNLLAGTRLASATGGMIGGAYAANSTVAEGEERNIPLTVAAVAAGGALGYLGGRGLANRIQASMDAGGRALRYAYLADNLANIRDKVRFSLSPIFDASRYSEATILGQIGDMPEGLRNLRVNQSPSAFRRQLAREFRGQGMDQDAARRAAQAAWGRYQDEFAAAARGYRDFDWEVIDGVGRRFSSVGILGFSPTDWMSSTYAHMRRGGADPAKAYEAVRDIYTYGTTGRSAAELSMNFVFFPFSFTKKTVGHLGSFFSDDLSRLIILHDMVATYQLLDERFNLSEEWKDRLPILQKAHRLNLLAYGIGLGQFGGVNAPLIGAAMQLPGISDAIDVLPGTEEIVNAFIPQMVPMRTAEDADTAWDVARQMLPVINDVNTLIASLVEQGHVLGSPEHISRQAEQRRAWEEWRAFQAETKAMLEQAGLTWNQATRRPELNLFIQAERARISAKYPSWKQGLGDGIAHSAAIDMELQERLNQPKSNADLLLARFWSAVERSEAAFEASFDSSPENLPPELFDILRGIAIDFSKEEPEFLRLYNRFFRRSMGDITTALQ